MRCPPEWGVKQFVAEIRSSTGTRFRVFTTGSDKYYLFDPIDKDGCSYCMGFPVLKARLRPELKRALRHGWGMDFFRGRTVENGGERAAEKASAGVAENQAAQQEGGEA
jgi:hypothetical protein